MEKSFKAFVVEQKSDDNFECSIRSKEISELPDHQVLVKVEYSSLNYKDALSATGNKGVTKHYPHVPGIDAAGVVEDGGESDFKSGDKVIVTSYDLGQNTSGGFGQYIRVPPSWVVPLPEGLSLRESMIIGTAGFTAAIGVHHLRHQHITAGSGPVLVTGATGGVGVMAISILGRLGYEVTAATGKTERSDFLMDMGASSVIRRSEVQDESKKPLLTARWKGTIDTVGGIMLDTALRQTMHNGAVACCGNILGHELETNVYPFILRGVTLSGMDSGNCPMELRKKLWEKLGDSWKPHQLEKITRECNLESLDSEITKILQGQQVGRVLVNLSS